jgi:hypothetical protein
METVIFSAFLFFTLALLGYAFYNKKVIYLAAISSFLLLLLGASILDVGLSITYAGSYGLLLNNTSAITGMVSTVTTFKDIYTTACGMFLVILGIMTMFLTFWFMLKGSEEDED